MMDEQDDDTAGEEQTIINGLKDQAVFHMVASFCLLVVMVTVTGSFMALLNTGANAVKQLIELKPESRVESFSRKVDKTLELAEAQYTEHLVKMEDKSIFTVSEKFKTLYAASLQSEQDNTQLLSSYRDAVYQISRKTKGSAEWYQFYNNQLNQFIKNNQQRAVNLQAYVHKDDAQDSNTDLSQP